MAVIRPLNGEVSLEEAGGGLPWVHWLLGSVRARCEHLSFDAQVNDVPAVRAAWREFVKHTFHPVLGSHLMQAWLAVCSASVGELQRVDEKMSAFLDAETGARSLAAGAVLLKNTRRARYQGALGHYRTAVERDGGGAHFVTVWAAVGHFFQLSLANVMAEYLRLEWETGTRHLTAIHEPQGRHSFAAIVRDQLSTGGFEPTIIQRAPRPLLRAV